MTYDATAIYYHFSPLLTTLRIVILHTTRQKAERSEGTRAQCRRRRHMPKPPKHAKIKYVHFCFALFLHLEVIWALPRHRPNVLGRRGILRFHQEDFTRFYLFFTTCCCASSLKTHKRTQTQSRAEACGKGKARRTCKPRAHAAAQNPRRC